MRVADGVTTRNERAKEEDERMRGRESSRIESIGQWGLVMHEELSGEGRKIRRKGPWQEWITERKDKCSLAR